MEVMQKTEISASPILPYDRTGARIDDAPVLYRSGELPEDFPKCLVALKEASGLSWNGLAEAIGKTRQVATDSGRKIYDQPAVGSRGTTGAKFPYSRRRA